MRPSPRHSKLSLCSLRLDGYPSWSIPAGAGQHGPPARCRRFAGCHRPRPDGLGRRRSGPERTTGSAWRNPPGRAMGPHPSFNRGGDGSRPKLRLAPSAAHQQQAPRVACHHQPGLSRPIGLGPVVHLFPRFAGSIPAPPQYRTSVLLRPAPSDVRHSGRPCSAPSTIVVTPPT